METKLLHSELTGKIIGAGLEVYNNPGQGFLESVYEEALVCELEIQKISFQRQKSLDIYYKGRLVKQFFCDILVEGKVLVELKAIRKITEIEIAQVINYLKATGLEVGFIFNFGGESFAYKRLINTKQ